MKTFNYLADLPQEASIKKVEMFRDYDLITLDLVLPSSLIFLQIFLVFPFISPAFSGELLVFPVLYKYS